MMVRNCGVIPAEELESGKYSETLIIDFKTAQSQRGMEHNGEAMREVGIARVFSQESSQFSGSASADKSPSTASWAQEISALLLQLSHL